MKALISALVALAVIVIGLSIYLAPDDLAGCSDKPNGVKGCQPADAIVAVSGGDTEARTLGAIRLYEHGWAPRLIFSGAAQDKSGPSNAEVMRRIALEAGVPADAIIIEEAGETTRQNAENTGNIFETNNVASVILVTSAYHQRRAGLEFSARSAGHVSVRNHPVKQDAQWSAFWWLTPTGWFLAAGEFVKIIAFYLGSSR